MPSIYILANGVMAQALAHGLKDNYEVIFVGRNLSKLSSLKEQGFKTLLYENFNLDDKNAILAFKPYAFDEVSTLLRGEAKILISVLANTNLNKLSSIKAQNIVRIMPNIAAKYKVSATPFVLKNEKFKDEILAILQSFGYAYELDNEEQMPVATAICGCGPAFLAMVAESIAGGGVLEGLNKNLSYDLTKALFKSTSELLKHEHPAIIKENVCSPAGVSIKGVRALEKNGIRTAFFEAISASSNK
ncbi:pyrroline-5-carboxylate reductase [Campylobacter sp. LR291e]|nr:MULTISPECIES: pyrroline-5-carboxylate reductase [unclassified Campylobacter]KAA6227770.1 pyrroline-5-carboxylate reductase [Campylobacter sp. LR196d]KAA6233612.1 pyrroline-5-carboxylate reductase [Campylobacter sp. LR291e]